MKKLFLSSLIILGFSTMASAQEKAVKASKISAEKKGKAEYERQQKELDASIKQDEMEKAKMEKSGKGRSRKIYKENEAVGEEMTAPIEGKPKVNVKHSHKKRSAGKVKSVEVKKN